MNEGAPSILWFVALYIKQIFMIISTLKEDIEDKLKVYIYIYIYTWNREKEEEERVFFTLDKN